MFSLQLKSKAMLLEQSFLCFSLPFSEFPKTNFQDSLSKATEKSISELEQEWKKCVLGDFDKFNVGLNINGKKLDDKKCRDRLKQVENEFIEIKKEYEASEK